MQLSFLKKKFSIKHLCLSVFCLILLSLLIYNLPPTFVFNIGIIRIPVFLPFIVLISVFLYFLSMFLVRKKIISFLVSVFGIVVVLFILNDFTNPLFFILLALLFVIIEILLSSYSRFRSS